MSAQPDRRLGRRAPFSMTLKEQFALLRVVQQLSSTCSGLGPSPVERSGDLSILRAARARLCQHAWSAWHDRGQAPGGRVVQSRVCGNCETWQSRRVARSVEAGLRTMSPGA